MTQKPVRVLYLVPSDLPPSLGYVTAINAAMLNVQKWYASQLGGRTFTLNGHAETLWLPQPAAYYAINSWGKIVAECPVQIDARYIWVIYADVLHACDAPGRLGAGYEPICIMPRQDMDSLIGRPYFDDCGKEYKRTYDQTVGGLAHELGHALGLDHPAGCGTADESACDWGTVMYAGFHGYPDCYLTATDKVSLLKHSAFAEHDAPMFDGYREISFVNKNIDLSFDMKTVNGELTCEVTDNLSGKVIDFTANEGSEWAWHFTARGGKLRPRSYDKVVDAKHQTLR